MVYLHDYADDWLPCSTRPSPPSLSTSSSSWSAYVPSVEGFTSPLTRAFAARAEGGGADAAEGDDEVVLRGEGGGLTVLLTFCGGLATIDLAKPFKALAAATAATSRRAANAAIATLKGATDAVVPRVHVA